LHGFYTQRPRFGGAAASLPTGMNGQVIKAFAASTEQQHQILYHLALGESRVALAELDVLLDRLAHPQGHHGFQQQKPRAAGDLVAVVAGRLAGGEL
jgi:hypothetical protein